ncbi:MAG: tetratricopeptide repeat protein [Pyrinomonadaceae bacterium]
MQKSVLFGIGGLIIGLIIGFFVANSINRKEISQQNAAQTSVNAPFLNQQTQAVSVKPNEKGGMLPEVSETLDKAKNEPNNFDAQMKAGDIYSKIQKFDTAVEFYEKANQIKPEDYDTIVKVGNTYFDSRQFEKAESWYEKALAKNPNDVNVRTDLGITFVERGNPDLDRAVKEFQTSLQTNPKHEPTLYNLGIAYFKKGNLEETGKILAQLEAINPSSQLTARLRQIISSK